MEAVWRWAEGSCAGEDCGKEPRTCRGSVEEREEFQLVDLEVGEEGVGEWLRDKQLPGARVGFTIV